MCSSSYELRILRPADLNLMRQLNDVFGEAFNQPGTYGADPPEDSYMAAFLSKQHVVVIVAVQDSAVIGGLVAYELEKFERPRTEFNIYDLAVEAPYRRRGIATACIRRLQAIASERRGWVIFVQADHGDEAAIALYQKLGLREDVLHFDIPPTRSTDV